MSPLGAVVTQGNEMDGRDPRPELVDLFGLHWVPEQDFVDVDRVLSISSLPPSPLRAAQYDVDPVAD
ncbi:hypothetical protein VTI28DRAFT_3716 [Corynascus sepedonium]